MVKSNVIITVINIISWLFIVFLFFTAITARSRAESPAESPAASPPSSISPSPK